MRTVPRKSYLAVAAALVVSMLASGLGSASAQVEWTGEAKSIGDRSNARFPKDRYALAGGCYAVSASNGDFLAKTGTGYAATANDVDDAEPFHFRATDLGRYLLFDADSQFLAVKEGALGQATTAATGSLPGQIAGGAAFEQTDVAAEKIADSDANRASGRGSAVVAAAKANELADWKIVESGKRGFRLQLPATHQALASDGNALTLVDDDPAQDNDAGSSFGFERTRGCAEFPEVEVNVSGPTLGGETSFQEVRGFMDLHLHGMAFEFLGGRARCARPWSPYGVTAALVDCPDHHPGGEAAALEQLLSKNEGEGHHPDGWPSFKGWPRADYLTHEQLYFKWLERAWRGGLRMYTNLLVDNAALCKVYPYKDRNHNPANGSTCNEMDGVRLQRKRLDQLQDYIDAQYGGPGQGWFRIVKTPFEAREVMNAGKLAVIVGIEVSTLFDCGLRMDEALCTKADIDEGLREAYEDLDVRQMELVNKFDSALSGVTGDAGDTGLIVNQGNKEETGRYWQMDTCPKDAGKATDKTQHNFPDNSPFPDEFTGRDSLVASILAAAGTSGAVPLYPPSPHCNEMGLTELGEHVIRGMADRGMIFDPDHMSAKARTSAMNLVEKLNYSGVVSSHSWADETIYPRIYEAGGVVTPSDSDLAGFMKDYRDSKRWADPRYLFGFGFGSDVNGFSSSAGPIGDETTVNYPFTGFGGAIVDQQKSGTKTYDVNTDGVAHYGLYVDWIQGLRQMPDGEQLFQDMTLGPEAYLQMWERALGIAPDTCRDASIPDLSDADLASLQAGMDPESVLAALGQPHSRIGNTFTYCATDSRTATLTFDDDGDLESWGTTQV